MTRLGEQAVRKDPVPDDPRSSRERRAIIIAIVICLVGACFSFKVVDRLAISNLAQVLGLLILVTGVPGLLRGKDVLLWIVTAIGTLVAAWSVLALYGYEIQWQYSLFYGLGLIWVLALMQLCRVPDRAAAVLRAAQLAIPFIAVYLAGMLALDLATGDDRRRLGFDDKSHASVYACILAFAALRVLKTPWRLLIALGLFVISLLTISRLPFIFAPGFLIAFVIEYRKVRRDARTPLGVYGVHLLLIGAFAAPLLLAGNAAEFFTSFDRVFRAGDRADASTQAHLLLLEYAARLKVDNLANFLFGVTPGGYSGTLLRSGIDVSAFAATDPRGYMRMLEGIAPMHSSTGTILLELPIWIGLAYLALMAWCAISLLRVRETVMSLMVVSLVIATTFYSSVTELYFTMAIALGLAAVGVHRNPLNPRELLRDR